MTLREKLRAFVRVHLTELLPTKWAQTAVQLANFGYIEESKLIPLCLFCGVYGFNKKQGRFQYRGYRDRTCSIGAPMSMHREGKAIDFDIMGWDAETSRKRIVELCIKGLPHPIRIEKGVNWVHIDVKEVENSTHKINFFAP